VADFAPLSTFRGADWRGRDCDDTRADVRPGRRPIDGDREHDSNCNGIKGAWWEE
jgi:acyloxyacyl hydrolase